MKTIDDQTLKEIISILESFLYNPHCETNITEGNHTRGFCKICANHYFDGQNILKKLLVLGNNK